MNDEIEKLREGIDSIDNDILEMICKRSELVSKIGSFKIKEKTSFYRPEREIEIYNKIEEFVKNKTNNFNNQEFSNNNSKQLSANALKNIFREIMMASINLEGETFFGYLGPPGSFSHSALLNHFGNQVNVKSYSSITEIFKAIESKNDINFGIVPIENSTYGSIALTLESLVDTNVNICSEIYLNINHNLLYHKKIPLNKIKKIYTLKLIKDQCREWLSKNLDLNKIDFIDMPSSTAACEMAVLKKDGAAIASELAASIYNLKILESNIHDNEKNVTRFFIITNFPPVKKKGNCNYKTSIVLTLNDKPGALANIINLFAKEDINLTKIESKTMRRLLGEYYFFIDFTRHVDDNNVSKILATIKENCINLKILGSYPISL